MKNKIEELPQKAILAKFLNTLLGEFYYLEEFEDVITKTDITFNAFHGYILTMTVSTKVKAHMIIGFASYEGIFNDNGCVYYPDGMPNKNIMLTFTVNDWKKELENARKE